MNSPPAELPGATSYKPTLVRALGVRALAANIVNTIVGSGIFVLPAVVAAILGPAAMIAYLICAALVALFGLCFAEVGSLRGMCRLAERIEHGRRCVSPGG